MGRALRERKIFCTSQALLAGPGNAGCKGGILVEGMVNRSEVREDVVGLIFLYLGKHKFFSHFQAPPACGELSCLYVQ